MLRKALILFVFLFVILQQVFAQISFDNRQVINKKSGLPGDNVNNILKDDLGFIWLATNNGLCRWDGISVKTFSHAPGDSTSIPGNVIPINAFVFDPLTKQIILATENGLSFFNPHTLTFQNFAIQEPSTNVPLEIHSVSIDRQRDIWLGTTSGIIKFNTVDHSSRVYEIPEKFGEQKTVDRLASGNVFDIKQDVVNDSILWLGTLRGLIKFNKYSGQFDHFYFERKKMRRELNTFPRVITHSNRKLYLGTWNAGMVIFNTVNEEFESSYGPYASESRNVLSSPLVPYYQKSENELWVSSMDGVGIFNSVNNRVTFLKSFVNSGGRPYAPAVCLTDGNAIWLSSEYGAIRMHLSNSNFENYFFPPVDKDHWFLTNCFFEDTPRQRLYIGYARGQGLHYFDLKTNTFHHLPFPKGKLKDYIIRRLLPLDQNMLLVLTPDDILQFSLTDLTFNPLNIRYADYPSFTDMAAGNGNIIWVSGRFPGMYRLDLHSGDLQPVEAFKKFFDQNRLQPDVKKIILDKYGKIWFATTETYGMYDPDEDTLYVFSGHQAKQVFSFYKDNPDTLWAAMSNGLGYLLPAEPEKGIQDCNTELKKSVYGIQRDGANNFYLLTPAGIEKFISCPSETVVFSENEGLVKYSAWENRDPTIFGKLFKLSDGRMIIGYRRGLGFFQPDSLHKSEETFSPYIASLKISGKEYPLGETLNSSIDIVLNHNQNALTFDYSALALENGKNIRFYHWLTDVDNGWISSTSRNINYSGLRPGNYRFTVKAESSSSPGVFREASLNFIIRPPWWNRWWAYALFVLIIAFAVYTIYNYNLSRTLERKEASRLKELNTLKSRLYANITHEFRTPLTVIKGMTDDLIENMSEKEQNRFANKLKMIERNSNKLLHLVKQMLDMTKIESGKMKLDLIQNDVISYLQYVLESFQSMADVKNIKLVFYHETDKVLMDYDEDKIFIITSNLLSNAIKFTPRGGKVIFHVKKETTSEKNYLKIKVQDSGIGIDAQHLPHIFDRFYQVDNSTTRKGEGTGIGLALTKELVELMKGRISVRSIPDESTEFSVLLPITNHARLQKPKPVKTQSNNEENETVEFVTNTGNGNLPLLLIVEDNPDVAKYIISCLAGKYRVKWSPDGKHGIETAINSIPDIIISDVMMPEKDGFEVCEILKTDERTSHIPIILLTAKATETDRIEGLSHGADAYLIKPFNKKELFVRLEQLIKIRRALQEKYSRVEISLAQKAKPTGEERFLKKAVEIIKKNLDEPGLNAFMLAENLNMSESQLYRKLKALGGKSTALFIRGIRLSAAKGMLKTTTFNISEIAYQCGFNDPAWFSKAFKEEFGVSPSGYRK